MYSMAAAWVQDKFPHTDNKVHCPEEYCKNPQGKTVITIKQYLQT